MKTCAAFVISLLVFASASQVAASDISPDVIAGRYDVNARAFFKKVRLDFKVLNEKEFEIFQYDRNGQAEETCNGTYTIVVTKTRVLKGIFNCPSNRSKMIDFNLDFQSKSFEELVSGTSVIISTSLVPIKIKASVVKMP